MSRKLTGLFLALVLALSLAAFAAAEDVAYPSRGAEVPATVVLPAEGTAEPYPLVVLVHGHGGSRHENIGFGAIADALSAQGIATIRMDFPGCGDSSESFQLNTLTNMKQDVLAAIDYMAAGHPVDAEKVGIFGYSMGGRIALELIEAKAYAFDAAVFLAPAADTEDIKNLFGGAERWDALKAEAEANGFAVFTTIYGQVQELSKEWFADLEADANPAGAAAAAFDGPALVIFAQEDEAVSPKVSEDVAALFDATVLDASGDGHSYGFYSDKTEVLDTVVNGAADFFADAFK